MAHGLGPSIALKQELASQIKFTPKENKVLQFGMISDFEKESLTFSTSNHKMCLYWFFFISFPTLRYIHFSIPCSLSRLFSLLTSLIHYLTYSVSDGHNNFKTRWLKKHCLTVHIRLHKSKILISSLTTEKIELNRKKLAQPTSSMGSLSQKRIML